MEYQPNNHHWFASMQGAHSERATERRGWANVTSSSEPTVERAEDGAVIVHHHHHHHYSQARHESRYQRTFQSYNRGTSRDNSPRSPRPTVNEVAEPCSRTPSLERTLSRLEEAVSEYPAAHYEQLRRTVIALHVSSAPPQPESPQPCLSPIPTPPSFQSVEDIFGEATHIFGGQPTEDFEILAADFDFPPKISTPTSSTTSLVEDLHGSEFEHASVTSSEYFGRGVEAARRDVAALIEAEIKRVLEEGHQENRIFDQFLIRCINTVCEDYHELRAIWIFAFGKCPSENFREICDNARGC